MNNKELKFKRTIKIISEVAGLVVLGLTTALFLSSIAVTLCVHDTFTVDSRLFAQVTSSNFNPSVPKCVRTDLFTIFFLTFIV